MGIKPIIGKHGTKITEDGLNTTVRYHSTDVFILTPHYAELNSGGWRTVTTRKRINQCSNNFMLGWGVFQKEFEWFVLLPNGNTVPFKDSMRIQR